MSCCCSNVFKHRRPIELIVDGKLRDLTVEFQGCARDNRFESDGR